MVEQFGVTVVGIGSLGAAVARALLARGYKVTVWNRSQDKTTALIAEGAHLAQSPADAVATNPITIMCLLDYVVANDILREPGVGQALSGRTLVQLTGGVPELVVAQQRFVHECNGQFLSGAVMAFARNVGRPDSVVVYAGDSCFDEHRALLSSIGGSIQYLGADPVAATAAFNALSTYLFGALVSFLESAAIARYYGISIDTYYLLARLLTDEVADSICESARRLQTRDYVSKDGSIDSISNGMHNACESLRKIGIPSRMIEASLSLLQSASSQGYGESDIARVVEILLSQRHSAAAALGARLKS